MANLTIQGVVVAVRPSLTKPDHDTVVFGFKLEDRDRSTSLHTPTGTFKVNDPANLEFDPETWRVSLA